MTKRVWIVLSGLAAVCAMMPEAYAVEGCRLAGLSGNFAMRFSGTVVPSATGVGDVALQSGPTTTTTSSVQVAGVAHLSFDGNGNVSGYSAVNARSAWQQGGRPV